MNQQEAISFLRCLAQGINIFTGEKCKDDEMLRDPDIVHSIHEVILTIIELNAKPNNDFLQFDKFATHNIKIDKNEISITPLSENIESVSNFSKSKLMKIIQEYLIENGFLEIKQDTLDNKDKKFATLSGERIGIKNVIQTSQKGTSYHIVKYSTSAQTFIISKLDEIANYYNSSSNKKKHK